LHPFTERKLFSPSPAAMSGRRRRIPRIEKIILDCWRVLTLPGL